MSTETTEGRIEGRDAEAFLRFVERFASVLADGGWPRMPARVFVCLLAVDSGRLTAAELAEALRVSPAAISGAVRYLGQVGLISREREPGSRRDVYQVRDDVWYEAAVRKDRALTRWETSLREGIEVLGPDSPAGRRMTETLEFFEFVQGELPSLLERWRAVRDELRAKQLSDPS
ncbi:GbsR/MarR family transcriptional regulator [Allokutzneria sp. NRRL B-24872]|uniref:GbsR/MarR family transcriptional regulator n=1 Tax=Allokutzneria sp. NRRL B-24872 TaxID=1137961 RepID=UPI000A3AB2B1|nr:MarR family transcriptional regulator [Allokutzneria sp. NRRL B-24872]